MTGENVTLHKDKHIGYWLATGLLAFGMFSGGAAQFFQAKVTADGFKHLGYPLYFMSIIGAWKIAGVVVLLINGFPLLKEWAYAGFLFVMTGAVISHAATGDTVVQMIAPFTFACLTVISWYLRPTNRRITMKDPDQNIFPAH